MNKLNFFIRKNIIDCIRFPEYKEKVKENKKIIYEMTGKKVKFIDIFKKCYPIKGTLEDYFWFKFYKRTPEECAKFITYGRHQDIYNILNPEENKKLFKDKGEFNKIFKDFLKRDFIDLREASLEDYKKFVEKHPTYISKPAGGSSGYKVEKIKTNSSTNLEELYNKHIEQRCFVLEEVIIQHPEMAKLNPNSVNTIRVVTSKTEKGIRPFIVAMRIGAGDAVADNLNNGGMACSIDTKTGKINSHAITKKIDLTYDEHPKTKVPLLGFQIPNYDKVIECCLKAHELLDMDLIGFDIAITKEDCCIVEGNSTPMYDIIQMPKNEGRYYEFLEEFTKLKGKI